MITYFSTFGSGKMVSLIDVQVVAVIAHTFLYAMFTTRRILTILSIGDPFIILFCSMLYLAPWIISYGYARMKGGLVRVRFMITFFEINMACISITFCICKYYIGIPNSVALTAAIDYPSTLLKLFTVSLAFGI
jgi:hypothetical protein